METVKSYVRGAWHEAGDGFRTLVDPSTEEPIARVSSTGVDFAGMLAWARERGGPALRRMTFAERGALLKAMAGALRERREELLELSRRNNGATEPDGAFDVDGASGTLAYYAFLAKRIGDRRLLAEDEGVQLARSEGFWGQHVLVPRRGVAVHVNAFNFPCWGFAEKAACALLAGMPVITKPATPTALVAGRCVEIVVEAGVLPEGALQMVCGSTGDLLDRLGPQDVLAFTGSAATARSLKERPAVVAANGRFNVEADSLNAAVLGPDVEAAGPTWKLFLDDVVREITQKTGQKCTAVRRILAPAARQDDVEQALVERLGRVVTGHPAAEGVTMGPVATAGQLADCLAGLAELAAESELLCGSTGRVDGVGSTVGKGYFLAPTLVRAGAGGGRAVHRREVFGPVATVIPYDGSAAAAGELVARAGGTLVTSVYGDDREWLGELVAAAGSTTGRLYVGSAGSAGEAPGSGVALPQALHGGPGRAGGGEELGGLLGVKLYMQRLALQGDRTTVEALAAS